MKCSKFYLEIYKAQENNPHYSIHHPAIDSVNFIEVKKVEDEFVAFFEIHLKENLLLNCEEFQNEVDISAATYELQGTDVYIFSENERKVMTN